MDQSAPAVAPFEMGEEWVAPGERRIVHLPVICQLSGVAANMAIEVLHGARSGPCVFVSAAVHGDEINGIAIIQQLRRELDPARMAGTLLLVPAVNIFGLLAGERYLPDRRDLNRSFPGSARGSMAAQLAHAFLVNVIDKCTLGIDLHTAAIHRYNLPQIRIASGNPYLVELAMAFGAPVIIESPLRDGSMRSLAHDRGTPMLLLEAGEALRFDQLSIELGIDGIQRVLAHIGMIEKDDGLGTVGIPARANRSTWVRAPRGGIMHRLRDSGTTVHKGDPLGTVSGLFGDKPDTMISPIDGVIIGHATLPVVNQGDALFHIAEVANLEHAGELIGSITQAILASEPEGQAQPMPDEDELL